MNTVIKNSEIRRSDKGVKYCCPEYHKQSTIAANEYNDCVVRATASAFNVHYDEAHKWVKDTFNRVDRRGTRGVFFEFRKMIENGEKVFGKNVVKVGEYKNESATKNSIGFGGMIRIQVRKGVEKKRKLTVGRFLKEYTKGTYFMLVRGHAFTIKEGVVYGNFSDSIQLRTRIEAAIQVV